ncbi:MAG: parvulin peptidyl-prolyl isomerase, partial [Ignavibacteriae bacterium]
MKIKIILFILFIATITFSQEVLDRVVAVVDNEIILQSELEFQASLFASQRGIDPNSEGLKEQILKQMIDEKLVYAQAELDTIEVTEEEISQQIEYQINVFQQQYGSQAKIEEMYGMSIDQRKRELRDDVRKNLMVQRLREKNFAFL